jgi:hypothetical protein
MNNISTEFLPCVLSLLVAANVAFSSTILITLMMEALPSSEMSVIKIATRRNIPEDGILHSHRRENLKSYIALTGWLLQQTRNVFPFRYELGSYIPEDGILHSHRRGNLKSYIALTGWLLKQTRNVFPFRYELGSYIPEDGILHSHRRENLKP